MAGSKDNNLYAFNPILGTEQFVYETGGDVESPSVFEHNQYGASIVFGSDDGYLYGIDGDGNNLPGWPQETSSNIVGSISFSEKTKSSATNGSCKIM